MKALSESQARSCENSTRRRCRCRCRGTLHGAGRVPIEAPREVYELLPPADPHHLLERRRRARETGDRSDLLGSPGRAQQLPASWRGRPRILVA